MPFFADDYLFLDQVRGHSLLSAWRSEDPLGNFWRPVGRQLYFWVVSRLGESPAVAHALNLGLFLLILGLLFLVARRYLGPRGAVIATAILALHYVADAPLQWASGSQDLLAVAAALLGLRLAQRGAMIPAALSLGLGLLAKETVAVTPIVAVAILHTPGERWLHTARRAWPLFVIPLLWLPIWLVKMHGQSGGTIQLSPSALPAAILHFLQVSVGAEWTTGLRAPSLSLAFVIALGLALAAVAWGVRRAPDSQSTTPSPPNDRRWLAGAAWAIAGTLPVVVAVHIWSAYYYLFALCGLAVMLGALLARRNLPLVLGMVTLLATGSAVGRDVHGFSTSPGVWNTESHFNPFYFSRSMHFVTRYLEDLRTAHPTLPAHSTLYFAGTPAYAAWQIADGALARWIYRDPTLHSFYLSEFGTQHARAGPAYFFFARDDSLFEVPEGPERYRTVALAQALSDHDAVAGAALEADLAVAGNHRASGYWLAWMALVAGDSALARRGLSIAGCAWSRGPSVELASVRRTLAAGDTLAALEVLQHEIARDALDPELHALLADVLLRRSPQSRSGIIEALAARALSPRDPSAWKRWGLVQAGNGHLQEAYASLSRYFELAGAAGPADIATRQTLETLRRTLPGGELAQRSLDRGRSPTP